MLDNYKNYIKNRIYNISSLWKFVEILQGFGYAFKYYYHYVFKINSENTSSLNEIYIEFSSACNLRCGFCSLDHAKPSTYIEEETLRKFLENFISDKRFRSVKSLQLHNAGETLLHPKKIVLLEIIKEYKDKALSQGIKFPEVHILTNGMLLKERVSKAILDIGIIDVLRMSLDGGSPEAFEEMRDRAKWPIFYKNVKDFVAYNKEHNCGVKVSTISIIPADKDFKLDWMHPEFREVLLLVDSYELRRLHNWAGEIEGLEVKNKPYKIGCNMAMDQMVLLPNGDVTVCCSDLNSKGVIGNFLKDDIYTIYSGKRRRAYLDLLFKGQKDKLDLCKGCETF